MNKNDTLIKLLFGVIQGLMIAVLINLWAQLGTLRVELNDIRAVAAELKERVRVAEWEVKHIHDEVMTHIDRKP